DAVRQKKIRLIPESWEANYFGWMENIEDWCISRQIWWGHQIPVWYCRDCDPKVLISRVGVGAVGEGGNLPEPTDETVYTGINARPIVGETSCPKCGGSNLVQDPDVLDTWFSSALWPFSTLGWPAEQQPDDAAQKEACALLTRFYPTAALVSGFDILFFWVARMIMMGLHFMKDVPFRDVYIHALVRDAEGQKMSKSKGNVIDPLDLMDRYGTDALRFTLAAMASPGRDIKLSEDRIEGYRNFCNKLWNAARFILMHRPAPETKPPSARKTSNSTDLNHWLQSRLHTTIASVNSALEQYRFDEAAQAIYQFTWHTFCDWGVELAKVDFQNEETRDETYRTLSATFKATLSLLHPFMPFLTEELLAHFQDGMAGCAIPEYPQYDADKKDMASEERVQSIVIDTVLAVRNMRGEMNIPPSEALPLIISVENAEKQGRFEAQMSYIKRLARLSDVRLGIHLEKPARSATAKTSCAELYLPLDEERLRDELARIGKRLDKTEKSLGILEKKLGNAQFTANAPKQVVEKARKEREALLQDQDRLSGECRHLQSLLAGGDV
ncbi:MAG: class I tRNA ligase family protein, partial [Nitrospiria bacterium]